jgi:hypothetical protein
MRKPFVHLLQHQTETPNAFTAFVRLASMLSRALQMPSRESQKSSLKESSQQLRDQ